jgi:hypothetical protein
LQEPATTCSPNLAHKRLAAAVADVDNCSISEGVDEQLEDGMMAEVAERLDPTEALPPGTRVEVRKRFDASWAHGFEVISVSDDGYRLRRMSDGHELPADFSAEEVRREKARKDFWWY